MERRATIPPMPFRAPLFLALFATLVPAQTPPSPPTAPAASKPSQTLQRRLLATAALGRTAFTAEWQWPGTQTPLRGHPPQPATRAAGAFYDDALLVTPDLAKPTAVLHHGRHAMLRLGEGEWRLTGALRERGIGFVPDPPLLLRCLASSELQIGDRSTGERAGRAVELVAATLTAQPIADLVHAGAMLDPQPFPTGLRQMMEQRGIRDFEIPTPVVDLGLEFDVATGLLTRLRLRSLCAPIDTARIRQLAGGRAAIPPGEAEGDATPAATPGPTPASTGEPTPALRYEDGMPVRATEGLQERTFELQLRDHGTAPALELDARQRRLLGRDG